jgi:hypothetical protein
MGNGYDSHSLKATGLTEAMSSSDVASKGLSTAVRDKRFTKRGIGYRTQKESTTLDPGAVGQNPPPIMYPEAGYPGGTAARRRGAVDEAQKPWETAQEATRPQIKPRQAVERFGMNEALPPWLKGKGGDEEEKEAAIALVRENMGAFPCEDDARIALAVLSQFVDGDVLDSIQGAIENQYGDPSERPEPTPEPEWDDEGAYMSPGMMGESDMSEAPLNAKKRDGLDSSDFAISGRRYPIDTPARARAALARVKQFGKAGEEAKVKAAVKKKYPNMDVA